MSQTKYWVVNPKSTEITIGPDGNETKFSIWTDDVIMTQVLGPDDIFEPPPPVRHGIEHYGWRVISKVLPDSGLNDMGSVDWKTVADDLASSLRTVLEAEDVEDPEPTQQAGSALDNYSIAQHEQALRDGPEVEIRDDDG